MGSPCLFSPCVTVILSAFPSCASNVQNFNNRKKFLAKTMNLAKT